MDKIIVKKLVENKRSGDNCEKCECKEKYLYLLVNYDFGIDIILCPKCLEKFKKAIADIQIN